MPAGRPLIFETVEELQSAIKGYCDIAIKPTLSGLAYHLGIDRQTLYNYQDREEFFDSIKRAKEFIESKYEERLIYDSSPTGVIFALKNMGWSDKQEIEQKTEHSGTIEHKIDHSKLSDAALREIAALDKPTESKD